MRLFPFVQIFYLLLLFVHPTFSHAKDIDTNNAGILQFGVGASTATTKFDSADATQEYSGPMVNLDALLGKLFFVNLGMSFQLRSEGEFDLANDNMNYNDLYIAWLGVGINLRRVFLKADFAFGSAKRKYNASGQTGFDYTKDEITNLTGFRGEIVVIPFTWGSGNALGISGQYMKLDGSDFERTVYTSGVAGTPTKPNCNCSSESLGGMITYIKVL